MVYLNEADIAPRKGVRTGRLPAYMGVLGAVISVTFFILDAVYPQSELFGGLIFLGVVLVLNGLGLFVLQTTAAHPWPFLHKIGYVGTVIMNLGFAIMVLLVVFQGTQVEALATFFLSMAGAVLISVSLIRIFVWWDFRS